MTTKPNDGGPAFPFQANDKSNIHMQTGGMSLRDYFAAQALIGLLSGQYADTSEYNLYDMPREAWRVADAMLANREETQS